MPPLQVHSTSRSLVHLVRRWHICSWPSTSLADCLQWLMHRSAPHLEGLFLSHRKALWKDLRQLHLNPGFTTCDKFMVWIGLRLEFLDVCGISEQTSRSEPGAEPSTHPWESLGCWGTGTEYQGGSKSQLRLFLHQKLSTLSICFQKFADTVRLDGNLENWATMNNNHKQTFITIAPQGTFFIRLPLLAAACSQTVSFGAGIAALSLHDLLPTSISAVHLLSRELRSFILHYATSILPIIPSDWKMRSTKKVT